MRSTFLTIFLLGIVGLAPVVAQVSLSRFEAKADKNDLVITWQASAETNIREYILERKTRYDVTFKELKRLLPKGINKKYEYRDDSVYKTAAVDEVQYRLRVQFQDGSVFRSEPITIQYTSTAIRRTWGSIKAMFQ